MSEEYPNYQQNPIPQQGQGTPQGQYPPQGNYRPQNAYQQGYQGDQYGLVPSVIESASATTSPDNANSDYTAYILFGIATIVLTLLLMGLFGILRAAFTDVANEFVTRGIDHPISYDLERGLNGYDDIITELGLETVEG